MKLPSISLVMRAEHARLAALLLRLIPEIDNDPLDLFAQFTEFKWNIEKHFFVEEKAIFGSYPYKFDIGRRDVNLLAEHKQMRAILKEHEKALKKRKKPNFSEFKEIMLRHQEIEDDYFYIGLENSLDKKLKEEIVKKTMEFIKV